MRKCIHVCAAVLVAVASGAAAAAEPNMAEGKWEVTGKMTMEGLPFRMPAVPISYSQCLTKKDLVPQQKEQNKDCKLVSQKIQGNIVTWVGSCVDKDGNKTDSTGTITYKGSSFDGKIDTVMRDPKGAKTTSKLQITGQRTGDCT